jgi:hypothetical protein
VADQTTTTADPNDPAAQALAGLGSIGDGKTTNPLDKSASASRYVTVYDRDPSTGKQVGPGRTVLANPLGVDTGFQATVGTKFSLTDDEAAAAQGAFGGQYGTTAFHSVDARYDNSSLDQFAGLSQESMFQVQQALVHAGLLAKFSAANFDTDTRTAMSQVLSYANRRGVDWQTALGELAASPLVDITKSSRGPVIPAFKASLTNPDDLKATFKQAVYNATGGNFMDDSSYDRMVSTYQQQELDAQRAQYDASIRGSAGGTEIKAPNATNFATTDVQQNMGTDVQAKRVDDYANILLQTIGAKGTTA